MKRPNLSLSSNEFRYTRFELPRIKQCNEMTLESTLPRFSSHHDSHAGSRKNLSKPFSWRSIAIIDESVDAAIFFHLSEIETVTTPFFFKTSPIMQFRVLQLEIK